MPRTITLTFDDGSSHVYQDVPDTVTPDQVEARASADFAGKKLRAIDGGGGVKIPTAPSAAQAAAGAVAPVAPAATTRTPSGKPATVGDKIIGAGEAALSTATGMTGGTLGMIGGTAGATAAAILDGSFGTKEAAQMIEQAAAQGAESMTYAPRTESGQAQAEVVGQAMQQILPMAPVAGGMVAPGSVAAARGAVRTGAAAVLDRAATAMPQVVRDRIGAAAEPVAAPVAPPAAPVAPVQPMAPEVLAATARKAADGGLGAARAERILAEQAAPDQAIAASAKRLGIEDYLQPDHVTSSEAYRQVAAALKSTNPGSPLSLAEREGLGRVAQRAADLVDELGGSRDLSAVDNGVKTQMLGVVEQLSGKADELYAKLRDNIPAKTAAPADNVLAFIADRADKLDGAKNLTELERSIVSRLTPKTVMQAETVPGNPLMPGQMTATTRKVPVAKQPTYTLLDDVRKDVGAAARKAGPFADADTGLAKKLYELITADQDKVAGAAGMSDVLAAAKAAVAQRKGIENDLASLFGKHLDQSLLGRGKTGLSGAVAVASQGDASALTNILAAVPQEMRQQVVMSGVGSVFAKATAAGQMDFTGYAKWYEGLRNNRKAYTAVMANLPMESRKQLAALYNVSRGVSDSLNRRISTGKIATVREELLGKDTLLDNLYSAAKRGAVGATVGTVASTVMGPGVGAALAAAMTKTKTKSVAAVEQLIASPEFAHLVRTSAGSREQAIQVKKVAKSQAFKRFVRAVGNPAEMADPEQWIANAMRPQPLQNQQQDPRNGATVH